MKSAEKQKADQRSKYLKGDKFPIYTQTFFYFPKIFIVNLPYRKRNTNNIPGKILNNKVFLQEVKRKNREMNPKPNYKLCIILQHLPNIPIQAHTKVQI